MLSSKTRQSLFCLCITVLCLGCVEARPGNAFQPRSIAFETPYLSINVRGGSERSAEEDTYYSQRGNTKYGLEQSEQEYYRQDGKYNTDEDRYFDREYDDRGGFEPPVRDYILPDGRVSAMVLVLKNVVAHDEVAL